jgi:hypothetical protein
MIITLQVLGESKKQQIKFFDLKLIRVFSCNHQPVVEGIGAGAANVSGDGSPVIFTLLYFDIGVGPTSKQDILAVSSFVPSVIV